MSLDAKSLKALGFDLVNGKLIPIGSKQNKVKVNKVNIKISKQPKVKPPVLIEKSKKGKIDIHVPTKINTNNPFFKYLDVETLEHIKVVNYLKERFGDNIVWFHPMNEGVRSSFERYKMSLLGVLKGILDFIILHPKYSDVMENGKVVRKIVYLGLIIELKAPEHSRIVQKGKKAGMIVKASGKASPEQMDIIERLNKIRYKACICFGADATIKVIEEYFYR
ncbi:MAG TPA: hypothetical protein VN026_08420 [Bacteroidia bacterium]|jgi:hypothetical protein|nr:hypothetical protein [Bacteroidia bacterium]